MARFPQKTQKVASIGSDQIMVWRYPGGTKKDWKNAPHGLKDNFNRLHELEWFYRPPSAEFQKHIAWRPIWCGGYDLDADGKKVYHHFSFNGCRCKPGPQILASWAPAKEVALGGSRGSSKSESLLEFLVRGDPYLEAKDPYYASYLNCPDYKFLVLRKNSKDLKDFFERAKKFLGYFGGAPTESPTMGFKFPSGAWGILDHIADDDAYEKYQGQEFTRIAWEEATQCPDEERYMKVLMSCRSSDEKLREQIMLTANPGGRGQRWFSSRFVKLRNEDGTPVQRGQVYTEPLTGRTRVFIFSTVEDNPYQMRKGYDKSLDQIQNTDPTLYRQWRFGDFDIVAGQYFEAFRSKRIPGEPENALHVIPPIKLASYWPRAIGLDWGYSHPSAVTWGCWTTKRQLQIYREYKVSRMSTVQLGAEIAKKSLADLEALPSHHMNLYLSHDAFHRTDDTSTEAEQIARGIGEVLGRDAAFVFWFTQEEAELEDNRAWDSLKRRQKELANRTHITIIRANNARKAGWNLIRDYLRWVPLTRREEFNEDYAKELLLTRGVMAWSEYKKRCEETEDRTLPVLQIWETCPELISGIESAVEDDHDREDVLKQDGDDLCDCLRHLAVMFPYSQAEVPRNIYLEDRLRQLKTSDPMIDFHSLVMSSSIIGAEYDSRNSGGTGLSIPRIAGSRRRAERYVYGQ